MAVHARIALAAAVTLLVVPVGGASAQVPGERPMTALFGGSTNMPGQRHGLDVELSVSGGHDDNVGLTLGTLDGRQGLSARYAAFDAALQYQGLSRRTQFGAGAGLAVRRLRGGGATLSEAPNYFGDLSLSSQLTQRSQIEFTQSMDWSPYYDVDIRGALDPDARAAAARAGAGFADFGAVEARTLRSESTAAFEQELTQTLSYRLDYGLRYLNVSDATLGASRGLVQHRAGIRFNRALGEDMALRLGYAFESAPESAFFEVSDVASETRRRGHNHVIDVGIDYGRPLTIARSLTLTLGIGAAVATTRGPDQLERNVETGALVDAPSTELGAVGEARLTYAIGESWTAAGSYRRTADYIEILDTTAFSDTVGLDVGGVLTRRVELFASHNYGATRGAYELGTDHFSTSRSSLAVRVAASQILAVFAEYSRYSYRLDGQVPASAMFPSALSRQSVRVGATLWLPLLRR